MPDYTHVTIEMPLPDAALSQNYHGHWTRRHRAAKVARESAYLRALGSRTFACPEPWPWPAATVDLTFYWPDKRRRDKDNAVASMKAALDGIADAGLVVNDEHFQPGKVDFQVDKSNPRVVITMRKLD